MPGKASNARRIAVKNGIDNRLVEIELHHFILRNRREVGVEPKNRME